MKVPLLDLQAQYRTIRHEIEPAVLAVFESQGFIMGPRVESCEKALAAYCRTPFALGVSSGTDALLLALMAEDIGAGDEVIAPAYTFFATAGSIHRTGARPVFVDIDPVSFNLDPAAVAAAVTPRTRALMPVHLYGQVADLPPLMALAAARNLVVIEDACQAIGAEHQGRRAGSVGQYGAFSFFPSKNLGGAGDGGLLTTGDPARAERARILRNHGMEPRYYHHLVGGNFRLDALQAAVVEIKLRHLDAWTEGRRANAARYGELFAASKLDLLPAGASPRRGQIVLPAAVTDRPIYNQYVVRAADRDALRAHLAAAGVGTEVYYPVPLHRQDCFRSLGYAEGALPESERAARETLALPVYPELTAEQLEYVVKQIAGFYRA